MIFFNLWKKRAIEIHLFESKISPFESASPIWGLLVYKGYTRLRPKSCKKYYFVVKRFANNVARNILP